MAHRPNAATYIFAKSFLYITLLNVHLNWLNWFRFLILMLVPDVILLILIGYMIFLLPFLGVMIMSLSIVSFLTHMDPRILCLQTAFIWSLIQMALNLKLIDNFYLWVLSKQLSYMFFNFFFSCISMPFSSCSALQKQKKKKKFSLKFPKIFFW